MISRPLAHGRHSPDEVSRKAIYWLKEETRFPQPNAILMRCVTKSLILQLNVSTSGDSFPRQPQGWNGSQDQHE